MQLKHPLSSSILIVLALTLLIHAQVQARYVEHNPTNLTNASGVSHKKHVIAPKLGTYEIDNRSSNGYTVDQKSKSVFGFEYEYRFKFGLSIGGDFLHFENQAEHPTSYGKFEMDTNVFLFNTKYMFDAGRFKPFAGIGVGRAYSSCDSISLCDGNAWQWYAGANYEWKRVGIHVMYRKLNTHVDAERRFPGAKQTEEIDISGDGLFLGVSIKL